MTDNLPPLDDYESDETAPVSRGQTRHIDRIPPPSGAGHVQPSGRPPQPPPGTGRVPSTIPPHRKPARRSSARARRDSGLYLPLWSLALMLLVVLGVAFAIVLVVVGLGGGGTTTEAEPEFVIITAVPSHTPDFVESVISTPTLPPAVQDIAVNPQQTAALTGPTLQAVEISPTPLPIEIGSRVEVVDVGDSGLNVRDKPGVIGTTILYQAAEGEIFTIVDGPEASDGFTWWRVQSVTNPANSGWTAETYLRVTN